MIKIAVKLLGLAACGGLLALSASANSVNLTLNGSGTIGFSSSGSGNLTVCLGGGSPCTGSLSATGVGNGDFAGVTNFMISSSVPISLTETSNCVFANASLSGITFAGGSLSGTIDSMTISQASSQVSSGLASLSGTGTITTIGVLTVNVPFSFSGTLNVGAGVDLCALPGGGSTGGVSPTPEPGTLPLAMTGLLLFGGAVRRWFVS